MESCRGLKDLRRVECEKDSEEGGSEEEKSEDEEEDSGEALGRDSEVEAEEV